MLARFVAIQRRKIGNFRRRDNHTTGVLTCVTRDTFQLARHINQRFDLFVSFVDFRQLRFRFEGLRQRHARIGWHQFRDAIDETIRMAQHATHVTDNGFRRHRTEGNNL
ncbi:hypothetical protein D3C86_1865030 [compost metagenome]